MERNGILGSNIEVKNKRIVHQLRREIVSFLKIQCFGLADYRR